MPVDDRTRLNLHRTLENTLGSEAADALMDHLPPVTWNQVATKDDLDKLATRAEMHVGFTELRTEMAHGTARHLKWMVTFAAAWSTLLLAAAQLLP